ncbi:hypothetical protein [Aequorivita capsosiphonis]|uniref:hypothetical protein n=1 Tax=Aequorivita capsosiphonis TaxID=487317 RepID=UPI00041BD795|nr:hypothetical protein [Aequorivita capsosiphonis]
MEGSALPSPEVSGLEGLAKWKAEIGDGIQDLCSEALFPKWSFSRNVRGSAERDLKVVFYTQQN